MTVVSHPLVARVQDGCYVTPRRGSFAMRFRGSSNFESAMHVAVVAVATMGRVLLLPAATALAQNWEARCTGAETVASYGLTVEFECHIDWQADKSGVPTCRRIVR